eukprot:4546748-Pyramimonas_sp.AAC.1
MGSGVKQGRPSSVPLFALAVDPLLRWAKAQCSSHIDRTLAYADDFCFGLLNAFSSLGPVLRALQLLGPIAGLALNLEKCQVLIVGNLDLDLMRD